MKAAVTGGSSSKGRLTSIACTIAAPVVLYIILRTAAAAAWPGLAASLPPVNDAAMLRQAARNAGDPKFKVDQVTIELAKRAAQAEPLDFAPFYLAARAADEAGDRPRTIALLEEARRRRPTWLPIRLLLTSAYFKSNRRQEMVREIGYTLRMHEQARIVLLPELVKLMRFPDGRRYLAEMLAENPPWEANFVTIALDRRVAPDHAEELLRLAVAQGADTKEEERLLVNALIAAGRTDQARARWLRSLAPQQREQSRFLYNGDFRSSPAAGEFGWTFETLGVGRADLVQAGERSHLRALYDGGSTAVLARQLIALAPGRYRLRATGRTSSMAGNGELLWVVLCHPEGPALLRLPVRSLSEQEKTIEGTFTVPAGCMAQSLRLVGEPGDMSTPVEVEFSRIEIDNAR